VHMQRKQLPYPVEGGLGKFLPPDALKTLVEYQDGLLERLDQELQSMYPHFWPPLPCLPLVNRSGPQGRVKCECITNCY